MNGSILDTNVITKLLDNDPAAISLVHKIDNIFTSIVVVGELYFAAANSSKREANFKKFQEALACLEIIYNDIWIAACAYAKGLSVATFDQHFSEIAQIVLVENMQK